MILIMPMAGRGSRFSDWDLPKPYIEVFNKPLFYWAYISLANQTKFEEIFCIILEEHNLNFEASSIISNHIQESKVLSLPKVENGPARTIWKLLGYIPENQIIIISDCDQAFFEKSFISKVLNEFGNTNVEAVISSIKSKNEQHGFIQTNKKDEVIQCEEKSFISDRAFGGIYAFRNKQTLEKSLNLSILNTTIDKEIFLSYVISAILKSGKIVKNIFIEEHVSMGTPKEFLANKSNNLFRKLNKC